MEHLPPWIPGKTFVDRYKTKYRIMSLKKLRHDPRFTDIVSQWSIGMIIGDYGWGDMVATLVDKGSDRREWSCHQVEDDNPRLETIPIDQVWGVCNLVEQ